MPHVSLLYPPRSIVPRDFFVFEMKSRFFVVHPMTSFFSQLTNFQDVRMLFEGNPGLLPNLDKKSDHDTGGQWAMAAFTNRGRCLLQFCSIWIICIICQRKLWIGHTSPLTMSLASLLALNLVPHGPPFCLTCCGPPFRMQNTLRESLPPLCRLPQLAPLKSAPGSVWLNLARANDMGEGRYSWRVYQGFDWFKFKTGNCF